MGSLLVLWFPPISQKHTGKWIPTLNFHLVGVSEYVKVYVVHGILFRVYSLLTLSVISSGFVHNSDQGKVVPEDE